MNLKVSIGKTIDDKKNVYLDLAKDNVHTIVFSGPTGSGKSTFHHSITKQIIENNTPKEVGFIFMDFKRVEFGEYKNSDYLYRPIIYEPREAVKVLKDLIHESEQRFKGVKSSEKAIVVHIEECDLVYFAPDSLVEAWKVIDEQSERNNIYMLFSSSRPSAEVFTPELLNHSNLKGVFIPGDDWYKFYPGKVDAYASCMLGHPLKTLAKPWTRIFQLKSEREILCRGMFKIN